MRTPLAFILVVACACGPSLSPAPPTPHGLEPRESASPTPAIPSAPPAEAPSPPPVVETREPPRRCQPPQRVVGGITFQALCPGNAQLLLEGAFAESGAAELFDQVATDLVAVEREFDQRFQRSPVIYVFGGVDSYATGLRTIFGYRESAARWVAENSVAFFEPRLRLIGANWEAMRLRRPISAIRHELTHLLTLDACAPRCDLVPAWLNEGQARLAEAYIPGGEWRLVRVRYEAASMAVTGTLLSLSALTTQAQWNALTEWTGYYKYQQAARATELLREDIGGVAPIARVYGRIRRGENIARAYRALTGRSFDDFVRGLPERIRSLAGEVPAITLTYGAEDRRGVSYLLYGFAPSAAITITVAGRHVTEAYAVAVSPQGAHFAGLGAELPHGRYRISVSGGDVNMTVTVVKRGGPPAPAGRSGEP